MCVGVQHKVPSRAVGALVTEVRGIGSQQLLHCSPRPHSHGSGVLSRRLFYWAGWTAGSGGGVLHHAQLVVARKRMLHTLCALHAVRDHMYSRLDGITSGAFGQLMCDEPLDTVLLGLLGDDYWGEKALAVDSCVRSFLVEAWAARELAVAARGCHCVRFGGGPGV